MRKFISGAVLSVAMGLSAVSGANAAAIPGLETQYAAFLRACVPTPTPACQGAIEAYLAAAAGIPGVTLAQAVASLREEAPNNTALQAAITTASGGTAAGPGDGSPA